MPSLRPCNARPHSVEDSFRYFYGVDVYEEHDFHRTSSCRRAWMKYVGLLLLPAICFVPNIVFGVYRFKNLDFFVHQHLWWLTNGLWVFVIQCPFFMAHAKVFNPFLSWRTVSITSVIFAIIEYAIMWLMSFIKIRGSRSVCKAFQCFALGPHFIWVDVLYPLAGFVALCVSYYVATRWKHQRGLTVDYKAEIEMSEFSYSELSDVASEMSRSNSGASSRARSHSRPVIREYVPPTEVFSKDQLKPLGHYWMLGIVFLVLLYIIGELRLANMSSNTGFRVRIALLIFLNIITPTFKFFLKRLARRVDKRRHFEYEDKTMYTFSWEIFTEFFVSTAYWCYFRLILVSDVKNLHAFQFFVLQLLHMFAEVAESLKRSNWYFHLTGACMKRFPSCKNKDDSTLGQWEFRCSIDTCIRFSIAVSSGIAFSALFGLAAGHEVRTAPKEIRLRLMEVTGVSVFIETIAFGILNCMYKGFTEPFFRLLSKMRWESVFLVSLSFVVVSFIIMV